MLKVLRSGLLRYILHTCPNLWCDSCSKCYGMDCFGTYFTHVPNLWCNSCSKCYGMDCFGTYFTHVQTCDVTHVQSATEWTASVHTSHMSKSVMWLMFKVLPNGLFRYILHTCPNLWCNSCSNCSGMDCLGTCCKIVQSCNVIIP